MATDSVDVCEVVRIAHIVQAHYPCCNTWLLFVHVSHRGVNIYSVLGQALKRLLLCRQQLESIPAIFQPEESAAFVCKHANLMLMLTPTISYLMYGQQLVIHVIHVKYTKS